MLLAIAHVAVERMVTPLAQCLSSFVVVRALAIEVDVIVLAAVGGDFMVFPQLLP